MMKRLTSGCSPTVDLSGSEQTADSADLAVFRALYPRLASYSSVRKSRMFFTSA